MFINSQQLRAILLGPDRVSRRPGVSLVDWFVEEMEQDEEFRQSVAISLAELLRSPDALIDQSGDSWQMALELSIRGHIVKAIEPIRELVRSRALASAVGDYADLHGRALEALNALDPVFDPLQCWKVEAIYRDYAPLAFSFIRDRVPWSVPSILSNVAQLGFLRDAIRTTLLRHSLDGFKIIELGAEAIKAEDNAVIVGIFVDCLSRVNLSPYQECQLRKIVGGAITSSALVVNIYDDWDRIIISKLSRLGFAVASSLGYAGSASKETWFVIGGGRLGDSRRYSGNFSEDRIIEVYREGDPSPSKSSRFSLSIPSLLVSAVDIASFICDHILSIVGSVQLEEIVQIGRVAPVDVNGSPLEVRSARKPSPATMEALEKLELVSK